MEELTTGNIQSIDTRNKWIYDLVERTTDD